MSRRTASDRRVEPVDIDIYDGRLLLGFYLTSKVSGFDAFDAAGNPLGGFNTTVAAANAIFEARRNSLRRSAA